MTLIRAAFIETAGVVAVVDGLAKLAGRMLGLFIFDGERGAVGDVVVRPEVGRGSVTSSVRFLGERQAFFQLASTLHQNALTRAQLPVPRARHGIGATPDHLNAHASETKDRMAAFNRACIAIEQKPNTVLDRGQNAGPDATDKE